MATGNYVGTGRHLLSTASHVDSTQSATSFAENIFGFRISGRGDFFGEAARLSDASFDLLEFSCCKVGTTGLLIIDYSLRLFNHAITNLAETAANLL